MTQSREKGSGLFRSGIRLSQVNVMLLLITLAGSIGMLVATGRINKTYRQMMTETNKYITSQQNAGMINEFAGTLLRESRDFLQTGDPSHAFAYVSQMEVIRRQIGGPGRELPEDAEPSDRYMQEAEGAFWEMTDTEIYAMRLMADTLPVSLEAYPAILSGRTLTEEDAALSPEEKREKAAAMLENDDVTAYEGRITSLVDASHRAASETVVRQMEITTAGMEQEMRLQRILVLVFIGVAVLALLANILLIIIPVNRSVNSLDRREEMTENGSFEMRHLARVYNEVLKENREKQQRLEYTAAHDALTGLYNRSAFTEAYERLRDGEITLLVLDVDNFRHFNDIYGQDAGDRVLKRVADVISEHFRKEDHISRTGGDEFCVIAPGVGAAQETMVKQKIDQINEILAQGRKSGMPPISVSVGIAFHDRKNPGGDILKDADRALLQLKRTGKIGCRVHGEQTLYSTPFGESEVR